MSDEAKGQPRLLDQVRQTLRVGPYSIHTERAYVDWIVRFVRFHGMRSREDLFPGEAKIEPFLTHLATAGSGAAATQNQAMNALVFLYKRVMQQPLDGVRRLHACDVEEGFGAVYLPELAVRVPGARPVDRSSLWHRAPPPHGWCDSDRRRDDRLAALRDRPFHELDSTGNPCVGKAVQAHGNNLPPGAAEWRPDGVAWFVMRLVCYHTPTTLAATAIPGTSRAPPP